MNNILNHHLYHFLAEGNIICGLEAVDSADAIDKLTVRLCRNNGGLDKGFIVEEVTAREKIASTIIVPGLAVPHARIPGLQRLLVALGTSEQGIDFKIDGVPPVKVVVLILTPKDDPGLHLQVLSALGTDFSMPDAINKVAGQKTPGEVLKYFHSSDVMLPEYLTARDVMKTHPVTMQESDTLQKIIAVFATSRVDEIPVLDPQGDIRGVISLEDILRFSLPNHILWMEDLTPIYRFQPFAEMLRNDEETKLADFMREDFIKVPEDLPAIQLAKIFLVNKCRQIVVADGNRLVGVVNLKDFVSKMFWE